MITPTYDGSGEATHPDVYDAGNGNTWSGYRYWMAMTPYPAGDATLENPSILASNDGDAWVVPAGLTNPIDSAPTPRWNSDTELLMVGSTLHCFYRQAGEGDIIKLRTSTDGVNWSSEQDIITVESSACLSPAIVKLGTQYVMFSNNGSVSRVFERRTASDPSGPWSEPTEITLPENDGALWHLNVTLDGLRLWMVWNRTGEPPFLISYSDDDGLTWEKSCRLVMVSDSGSWDAGLYRASLCRNDAGSFDMWYGGKTGGEPNTWRIGRTTVSGLI